jgi:hypothetical protein
MKDTILLDLEHFKKHNDHHLTENDCEKIRFYYGLAVPAIGETYCLLRGTSLTDDERKTLTYLGGITGLFDDFFDEIDTPEAHIIELINNPSIEITRNSHEKLFIQFYLKALEQNNSTIIKEYFNAGFDAQVQSKKQADSNLTNEEIHKITRQKGGIFMLFYRAALDGDIHKLEEELLFNVGLLGQMENDIFDIYKDNQGGIHTLATTATSIKSLRSKYQSVSKTIYEVIAQMDFQEKNKQKFSRLFAIIATRGLVCLDQLEKLEKNGSFEVSEHSRSQLICNMGSAKNIISWIGYYLKWDKNH